MSVTQPTSSDSYVGTEKNLAPSAGPMLARLMSSGVVSSSWDAVQHYLEQYPDLSPQLPNICAQARSEFGQQAELSLERYCDPEIVDEYLTLYVRLERYEPSIMDRISAISEQLEGSLESVSGYLLISTDFRRPRGSHGV